MAIDDGLMFWTPCNHPADNFWTTSATGLPNVALQQGKINSLTPIPNDATWATFVNIYKSGQGFRNSWRRYIEWDGSVVDRHFSTILGGEAAFFQKPAMAFAGAFSIDAWHSTQNTTMFSKGLDRVDYHLTVDKDDGSVVFKWDDTTIVLPAGTVTLGQWFFAMASGDASDIWLSLAKIDGGAWVNATGAGGTPAYAASDPFLLGASFGGDPIPATIASLIGKAQNIMAWDQKKNQTEMEAGILDFIETAAPAAGGGSGRIRSRIMMPVASRGVIT